MQMNKCGTIAPMQKISQYLGHTSMTVTVATYARYSPSFMADAGAAAEF